MRLCGTCRGKQRTFHAPVCRVVVAVLTWLALAPAVCRAQESVLSWDNVLRLHAGDRVAVKLLDGTHGGKILTVSDSAITLEDQEHRRLYLPREDVESVRDAGRHALLGGTLVAAGILIIAGQIVFSTAQDVDRLSSGQFPKEHKQAGAFVGIGVTTVGVLALMKGGSKTIYRKSKPQ